MPSLIAIDWGSTRLRAKHLLDGIVVAEVCSDQGIRACIGLDHDSILPDLCGHWMDGQPDTLVVASGMVGSREGWAEVPYVGVPATAESLAKGMVAVPSRHFGTVHLVPGVRWDDPDSGTTDVMRGEETQIAGLLHRLEGGEATVCLPGTHSKWATCRDGRIVGFRTWLTGEAFDRLTLGSLIGGDGTPADCGSAAFRLGVDRSSGPGGLLHHLFLARSGSIAGEFGQSEVRSFVSGLLVGHEIRAAWPTDSNSQVLLIGDSPAATATAAALQHLHLPHERITEDVHLAGIVGIVDRT